MVDVTCRVDGCDRPVLTRGYCRPHHLWSYRHGWAEPTHLIGDRARTPEQRQAKRREWAAANRERRQAYMRDWHAARSSGKPTGRPATHGMSGSPEFRSWEHAKARVTNPNHHAWHLYGGRGIRMCDEWSRDFGAFLAYMGPRPSGTSLDRIDPDGHYEPGNVRWANAQTQSANRRNVRR